ncbi:MAG: lipopolysaccharide heptosyltransferase II [Spirochaetaceae bacterium]|nr:lipopolysaccharide heptosyltransferase II [Spirochaetaceae bacterium]
MSENQNILLIQTAFIGDVVLTTPMIRALRKCKPGAKITVMVKPEARAFVESLEEIDEVLVIDKKKAHRGLGMLKLIRDIRKRNFRILLSPHQSHRTSIIAWLSGIPTRFGYRSAGFSMAYHHRLKRPMELPEIHRLLRFLKDSICPDVSLEDDIPHLEETETGRHEAQELLKELNIRSPILLGCSSVWATKRWTPHGFAELARDLIKKYKSDVLLIGSPADADVADQIIKVAREFVGEDGLRRIHNVCGKTSLPGLFSLMKRSQFLVSNDSAPVHFGCAARIPVVALFGPTVPSLGYAPIAPRTAVAELEGLYCRPCGTHGSHICPEGHFRCMRELTPAMVEEKILEVIN